MKLKYFKLVIQILNSSNHFRKWKGTLNDVDHRIITGASLEMVINKKHNRLEQERDRTQFTKQLLDPNKP
ncbi:hypothetical protein [Chryseolinea sp. H1M3-3]|uniref:hypothetical protein n=1 Tax=Chryseolinea sp. H1M3-3 TaxID=3034144 RepID=UPI0023EE05A2|nr:hypothetical protein [Chryseolinea sp. H1M3-3]